MIDSQSSDEEIVDFLADVSQRKRKDPLLAAEFAEVLANSGTKLVRTIAQTADVASTGGPASLSTLLCPLFLCAAGLVVPKLGVPGRPAGGIDCLAQIAGYRTSLSDSELEAALSDGGYAHFLASGRYAPLDARVFKLRQLYGFQEIPTLVAASLLSKKLAVGVTTAGLDIRVAPHGNFGRTMAEAMENADLFVQAAKLLGLIGRPVLTDGNMPYQPYIGRSEALVALADIFAGTAGSWLQEHVETCRRLSLAAAPAEYAPMVEAVRTEDLYQVFSTNIFAQGADEEAFIALVKKVRGAVQFEICADRDGEVEVSLEGIRRSLVEAQSTAPNVGREFPDPAGVILQKKPGEFVLRGDVLATVRVNVESMRDYLCEALSKTICVRKDLRGVTT
ncbi:hypothetical protein [Burkholderia ubonensis]|uniref:hypothetical protein n=1 Tax=Burkholderia ubonensis TaxID=101571 RepID=UPI000ACAED67|nr:hypothetical protein [Burkholderia ubonensis]